LLQSIERAPQQTRVDLTVGTPRPSEREPRSGGCRSKAGECNIYKKTARKYQDIQLRQQ
jgi:hypothetical protein